MAETIELSATQIPINVPDTKQNTTAILQGYNEIIPPGHMPKNTIKLNPNIVLRANFFAPIDRCDIMILCKI
tara:strand:+ start:692 stop:907 length:216 start_codon:yes stop_codon:yes gene_type:complete